MQALKQTKKIAANAKMAKMGDFANPKAKKGDKSQGELQGKIVRVVNESSYLLGQLVEVTSHAGSKVMGQTVFKGSLKDFLPQSDKVVKQITCDEKDVMDVALIDKPDIKSSKQMQCTDVVRAELECRISPVELQERAGLDKYTRLAAIHMDMWYWLLARDFDLHSYEKPIVWLRPEEIAQVCPVVRLDSDLQPYIDARASAGRGVGALGANGRAEGACESAL